MLRSCMFFAFLVLLAVSTRANADCPASTLNCEEQSFATQAPVFQTDCADRVSTFFDIPRGIIDQGIQSFALTTPRISDLLLRDEFTVSGPTPGSPIDQRLRVHAIVHTYAGGGADDFAYLRLVLEPFPLRVGDTLPAVTWGSDDTNLAFDDSLDVVIHRYAGEPIGVLIHAQLGVGNYCWGDAHLEFRFVDLPPGTTVTSCKGYSQEQPVGAEPLSWGRVKATYR